MGLKDYPLGRETVSIVQHQLVSLGIVAVMIAAAVISLGVLGKHRVPRDASPAAEHRDLALVRRLRRITLSLCLISIAIWGLDSQAFDNSAVPLASIVCAIGCFVPGLSAFVLSCSAAFRYRKKTYLSECAWVLPAIVYFAYLMMLLMTIAPAR